MGWNGVHYLLGKGSTSMYLSKFLFVYMPEVSRFPQRSKDVAGFHGFPIQVWGACLVCEHLQVRWPEVSWLPQRSVDGVRFHGFLVRCGVHV